MGLGGLSSLSCVELVSLSLVQGHALFWASRVAFKNLDVLARQPYQRMAQVNDLLQRRP